MDVVSSMEILVLQSYLYTRRLRESYTLNSIPKNTVELRGVDFYSTSTLTLTLTLTQDAITRAVGAGGVIHRSRS